MIAATANCACCEHFFPPPTGRGVVHRQSDFPIDVVYTWVNGTDPAHTAKRTRYLPPDSTEHAAGANLFQDNDELRYSLRSLAACAPWVRRVHIVTDGQRPAWLRKACPGLAIVDHREIIPSEYLPTFNSHVIEAYLHRIPGLAENYIYCNDDFFLTATAYPGDFFTCNGLPHLFMDWRKSRREGYGRAQTPHARSWWNTRAELAKRGVTAIPDFVTAHGPYPQTTRNARDAFHFFEDAIAGFSRNKFRTADEMAFYAHAASLWAYIFKRGVPCDVPYWYVNTKRWGRQRLYRSLLAQKGTGRGPLFLCLNDAPLTRRQWFLQWAWRRHLAVFLATRWPEPSPYEE